MPNFDILLTPIGGLLLGLVVVAVLLHIVVTNRSLVETGRVQKSLLAAAKRRALGPMTVVVELRRRAESLYEFLDHLAAHQYPKLEVVIVIRQTAGRRARADLQRYRKESDLKIKLMTYKKGMTDAHVAQRSTTGQTIIRLDPAMRLSPRFFEYVAYAFASPVEALRVRQYRRPEKTLISVWRSLSSLWGALFMHLAWRKPRIFEGLNQGMPVRRRFVSRSQTYPGQTVLFDNFGIDMTAIPYQQRPLPWWTRAVFAALVSVVLYGVYVIFQTTPAEMIRLIGGLVFAVYLVSSIILLSSFKGLTGYERAAVIALMPFYPLYGIIRAIMEIVRPPVRQKATRSRRTVRRVQPATR